MIENSVIKQIKTIDGLDHARQQIGVTDDEWAALKAEAVGIKTPTLFYLRRALVDPKRRWQQPNT